MAAKKPPAAKSRKLVKPAPSGSTTSIDIPDFDGPDEETTPAIDSEVNEDESTVDDENTEDSNEDDEDGDTEDDDPDSDDEDDDASDDDVTPAVVDPVEPVAEVKSEPYRDWLHDPSCPKDGIIIGPGEFIDVEGHLVGNFVTLTKPVYRALKQPNGVRWGYRLLYGQNAQVHKDKLNSFTAPADK